MVKIADCDDQETLCLLEKDIPERVKIMARSFVRLAVLILPYIPLLSSGCSLGPKAIEQTHGRYTEAVQKVEEEQFLTNIVRLRYTETSTELIVSSIATQYEVSAGVEARPFFGTESLSGPLFRSFSTVLPFAGLGGSNRPTISLIPQDDGASVRQLLTPISTDTLVFLGQTGWPVSNIIRIWVDRLNGVPNWAASSGPQRDVPPDFVRFRRATELLQVAQDLELISIRTEERTTELSDPIPVEAITAVAVAQAANDGFEYRRKADGWVLVKPEKRLVLEVNAVGRASPEMAEFAALLNLTPGQDRYELVAASGVPDPAKVPTDPSSDLRFAPRSTAQALVFLANGVEVPPEHVACGLVNLLADGTDPSEVTRGVFRVYSCPGHKHKPPPHAYLAIRYRDHWFYIDDRDQNTKATLLLMLRLRRLDFHRQQIGSAPALTLPVGP